MPLSFFDCYSLGTESIASVGRAEIVVADESRYNERKERKGVFALIPALLQRVNGTSRSNVPLALPASTSDAYRERAVGGYLPANYTEEEWKTYVRLWEQETGWTYNEYIR